MLQPGRGFPPEQPRSARDTDVKLTRFNFSAHYPSISLIPWFVNKLKLPSRSSLAAGSNVHAALQNARGSVCSACPVVSDSVTPRTVTHPPPLASPDKNIGVGHHFLLQGSSRPRDQIQVSCISCISRWVLLSLNHLGSPSFRISSPKALPPLELLLPPSLLPRFLLLQCMKLS